MRPSRSILSAGWVRGLLGIGLVVILGFTFGSVVREWLGAVAPPTPPNTLPAPDALEASAGASSLTGPTPSATSTPAPGLPQGAMLSSPGSASGATPEALTTPPPIFRIQVGAFLDHRNADRLVERLRSEGLGAQTSVFEQSQVRYRVLVVGSEGGSADPAPSASTDTASDEQFVETIRALGLSPESTADGLSATGLVPLREAVEVSHRLREQGIRVRLKQEVGSATYRIVRVGGYQTGEAAERALASLVARGYEGIVVRER